jgi:hypothetical protein
VNLRRCFLDLNRGCEAGSNPELKVRTPDFEIASPGHCVTRLIRESRQFRKLIAGFGFCWWWFVLKPVFDERRPFVGTWRLESPSPTFPARPKLVVEKDLWLDGTIIERVWDPETGVVDHNQPSIARWRLSKGRYQEVVDSANSPLDSLISSFGSGRPSIRKCLDSPVTWERTDRFRVQGPSPKVGTMTWSRREAVTSVP